MSGALLGWPSDYSQSISKTRKALEQTKRFKEFFCFQDPNLLDNFLDEVLGFQNDRSQEVRKFLIGFIEAGCQKDKDILPKVITNMRIFMEDEVLGVRKRVYQVNNLKAHLLTLF